MKTKYNNESTNIGEWTNKKIKDYYISYYDSIYGKNTCYGMSDLRMLNSLEKELEIRGIEISNKIIFN